MADNYLEYRQQELADAAARAKAPRPKYPSLDTLLHHNRSYRGYDPARVVGEDELREMVRATTLAASGMNRQPLRYRLVSGGEARLVLPLITLGGALPQEHLPHPGQEPGAFIVVCSAVPEDRVVDIDLGFAAQTLLLRATEMGLGGIFILNFRKKELREALALPLEPLAVIAVGKPAESVYLRPVESGAASLAYYRKDGVHYVPKLTLEQILI